MIPANKLKKLIEDIRFIMCAINNGHTLLIKGSDFYHDVISENSTTYHDSRLKGAERVWFVLDGLPVHQSRFTFNSLTGTITMNTFYQGSEIIITYIN